MYRPQHIVVGILGKEKAGEVSSAFQQGYKDSNLENDGIRIRCLTIWL